MKKILIILLLSFMSLGVSGVSAENNLHNVFASGGFQNDDYHWYENGVKQGVYGQKGNVFYDGTERGREIYDPLSNAWYWLDCIYDGAKADNKEVFMPYVYSDENNWINDDNKVRELANESNTYTEDTHGRTAQMADQVYNAIKNKTGKWVRYDENGKMIKGWYQVPVVHGDITPTTLYPDQLGNIYYYDYQTGLMAKGTTIIDNKEYFFNETTGVLQYAVENGKKVADIDFELLKDPHTHNWVHHDAEYRKIDPTSPSLPKDDAGNVLVYVFTFPITERKEIKLDSITECRFEGERCLLEDDAWVVIGYKTKEVIVGESGAGYWYTPSSWDAPILIAEAYDQCSICEAIKK